MPNKHSRRRTCTVLSQFLVCVTYVCDTSDTSPREGLAAGGVAQRPPVKSFNTMWTTWTTSNKRRDDDHAMYPELQEEEEGHPFDMIL